MKYHTITWDEQAQTNKPWDELVLAQTGPETSKQLIWHRHISKPNKTTVPPLMWRHNTKSETSFHSLWQYLLLIY